MELLPVDLVNELDFNGNFHKNGHFGNTTGTEMSRVVTGDGTVNSTEKLSETVNGTAQPTKVVNITGKLTVYANDSKQSTEVVNSTSATKHPSAAMSSTVNRKCNVDSLFLYTYIFAVMIL